MQGVINSDLANESQWAQFDERAPSLDKIFSLY